VLDCKVASHALKTNPTFSNIAFDHAKGIVEDHLLWRPFPRYPTETYLLEWLAPLFVLQLGVYRAYGNQDSKVRICMVDTRKAKPALFYPACNLLRIYGIKSEGKLSRKNYTHGDLLHGEMKVGGTCRAVTLTELEENGLYEHLSELKNA
jgi:hypothetical protein